MRLSGVCLYQCPLTFARLLLDGHLDHSSSLGHGLIYCTVSYLSIQIYKNIALKGLTINSSVILFVYK